MSNPSYPDDCPSPDFDPMPNNEQPTQPTAGAMRASVKIRESLERLNPQFRPSQTEWETWAAQIIDRETKADLAELREALTKATVSIQLSAFTQDHLAKQAAERRAFDEADGHRHTAALLRDELKEARAVLARHAKGQS